MELGASFSLGLTQIESTSNEINIFGFVPGSFAYEDVGFHENRFKNWNDPKIMKKLRDATTVEMKKTVVAISKGKRNDVVKRDPLPKGMKYVIKTVPHNPLRFGISFNCNYVTDVEYFVGKKVLNIFKETCFGAFVDIPKSNFQGQITKCLLMLECKQDNPNEFLVWVKGTVLKFTIFEFAIISGLNFTSNIEDFHKLMNSLRKDFFIEKQLYRLGGMPHVLNIWMYECCSEVYREIAYRIDNRILRICNWFVIETNPKFEKFMNGMFSKYVYTNIIPTVDELKCLQLPNNDGMDLKDSINSTLPSTSSSQHIKVDQKAKMIASSLLLDDFDDFTTLPPLRLLTRSKSKSDILLAPPSKRRKTDAEQTESVIDQENINANLSIKEVNESPFGTSNTITDPINGEAPHEPFLIDFGEQTPPTEQNPPIVESVDKRFNDIEALMKKHHEEMKKQHEEMMLDLKEKYDAPQKVVIEIDSSNKDVEKNETHFDDLGTLNEHLKNVPKKESETEVKNVAFQHTIDNTITDFSSLVSAIQSEELLQKENLPDLILPTKNTEVLNELQVFCTVTSSEMLQEVIYNIIASMCTPIAAMAVNSNDLSQKVNLPDLSLQTGNVEVPNELQESTKDSSTDASQESIDNIIAGISTPVVAIKIKFVSPIEISNNEYKMSKVAGDLNETPFDVEYIEDISQQVSGSLDCGVFVAAYAEFLSNQMQIPSS
ncbi:hypothetical protein FXO38_05090 [Capsicum annuum]|nr:hypothetical protein FXO38_05090 [Capsicum annuum]